MAFHRAKVYPLDQGETLPNPVTDLPITRISPLDPPPELKGLRESSPICRLAYPDGHIGWLVTSYELSKAILADKRLTITKSMQRPPVDNHVRMDAFSRLAEQGNRRVLSGYAGNFLNMDPPEHTRFRRMLAGEFTPKRIESLRARIETIVDAQLDAMERHGDPVDLVEHFAEPIPSLVICEILGVPNEVRGRFQSWSKILEDPSTPPETLADAYDDFTMFMYRLAEHPEELPPEALIPRLASRDDLNIDELVGVGVLLVAAGHQTVANQIALSVYALLAEPQRWEDVGRDETSLRDIVEELLRYLTIFQLGALTRTATEDIEVGDVTIRAGESITVSLSAANRDPERFADPATLAPDRSASGHVAFGHGIHVCLGQHLARAELRAALSGLVWRFPDLRLASPPDEVPMHPGHEGQAGPETLMVAW